MADDEGATNAEATPRRADAPSVADTRNMLAANGLILMVEACVGYRPLYLPVDEKCSWNEQELATDASRWETLTMARRSRQSRLARLSLALHSASPITIMATASFILVSAHAGDVQ